MTAYAETYVAGARNTLGSMLETGVATLGLQIGDFYRLFLESPYARLFERGDVSVIAGRSGSELALNVVGDTARESLRVRPIAPSSVFWTGWAIAYYQWACGDSFARINSIIPIEEVQGMFDPFHEADIRLFCEEMDRRRRAALPDAPCKRARLRAGLSQSELALLSGVPVRSIQQYEQRQKSIDRASAATVFALARALCCSADDLLERSAQSVYEYAAVKL